MPVAPVRRSVRSLACVTVAALFVSVLALGAGAPAAAEEKAPYAATVGGHATPFAPEPEQASAPGRTGPATPADAPATSEVPASAEPVVEAEPASPRAAITRRTAPMETTGAAGTASISGKISFPAGTDLDSGSTFVEVYSASDEWSSRGSAWVDETGRYTVADLEAGSYKLRVSSWDRVLLDEWWNDKATFASASAITLTNGQAKTAVDVSLAKSATLSGTVTFAAGTDLSQGGTDVVVYAADDEYEQVRSAAVAENGAYTVKGLPAGSYKIRFDAWNRPALDEWWNDQTTFASATTVALTATQAKTGVNATLAAAATIRGTVTLPDGIPSGSTYAYVFDTAEPDSAVETAWLQEDGTYEVTGLPAGTYKVQFRSWDIPVLDEWWNDKASFEAADAIVLTSGQTRTGVNAALSRSASIAGVVTLPSGIDPNEGSTYVYAYRSTDESNAVASAMVGTDGSYVFGGLTAGAYKLEFASWGRQVMDEWWDDAADFETADEITLTASQARTDVNATLTRSASISGTVTFPAGVDLSVGYTDVIVYSAADYSQAYAGSVAPTGDYEVNGLAAGTYKVKFSSYGRAVLDQWYSKKADYDSATTITVSAGQATVGINATLVKSAAVSGKVTFPAGISLASGSTTVYAYPTAPSDTSTYRSASVASNGTYKIAGLAAGSYRLEFSSWGRDVLGEYWDDKTEYDSATILALTAGQAKTGVNATLTKAASISGKVTFPAGVVRESFDTTVQVYSTSESSFYQTSMTVAADGTYKVSGLRAGSYKVKFSTVADGAASEWWNNKSDFTSADKIVLTSGLAKTGVNAALVDDATISGELLYPAGTTREEIGAGHVYAYTASDGTFAGHALAHDSGAYTIPGLPAGSYKLQFLPGEVGFAVEWWNDRLDFEDATKVTVTAGQDKGGVSATVARGASLSGVVTGGQVASGNGGAIAYRLGGDGAWAWEYSAAIDATGSYTIPGLRAGTYTVRFTDQMGMGGMSIDSSVAEVQPKVEWWDDKPDQLSATRLTLTAAQARAGIDANLDSTAPASLKTATPTITGTAAYGATLTAKPGTWTSGTALSYQWYASGKAISGATKSTLKLGTSQKAKTISVKVTGKKAGYASASKTSKATAKVATAGTPTISGTAKVRATLTAKAGTWTSGTSFAYQWYASGKAISKATKSTYAVPSSLKGKTITVKVTGKKSGYTTVAKTSKATAKVR